MGKVTALRTRRRRPVQHQSERHYLLRPWVGKELSGRPFDTELMEGNNFVIKGNFHGHLVVSVPEMISAVSAKELMEKLGREFRQPVVMLTHNVQFLSVRELSKKEIRQLQESVEARREAQTKTDTRAVEAGREVITRDEVEGGEADSDGDRSRISENGSDVSREGGEGEAPSAGSDSIGNEPSEKEGE